MQIPDTNGKIRDLFNYYKKLTVKDLEDHSDITWGCTTGYKKIPFPGKTELTKGQQ